MMTLSDRARWPGRGLARLLLAAMLFAFAPLAPAADEGRIDDVRMEVVEDPDADERDYVDRIELPEAAAPAAKSAREGGIERANERRDRAGEGAEGAREAGRETATEARELGGGAGRPGAERPGGPPEDMP